MTKARCRQPTPPVLAMSISVLRRMSRAALQRTGISLGAVLFMSDRIKSDITLGALSSAILSEKTYSIPMHWQIHHATLSGLDRQSIIRAGLAWFPGTRRVLLPVSRRFAVSRALGRSSAVASPMSRRPSRRDRRGFGRVSDRMVGPIPASPGWPSCRRSLPAALAARQHLAAYRRGSCRRWLHHRSRGCDFDFPRARAQPGHATDSWPR